MSYEHITIPETGEMIVVNDDNSITVPDNPIIPYIEGDGIGVDISPAHDFGGRRFSRKGLRRGTANFMDGNLHRREGGGVVRWGLVP